MKLQESKIKKTTDIEVDIEKEEEKEKENTTTHDKLPTVSQKQVVMAWEVWSQTRAAFKLPPTRITPPEESSLEGARYEPRTEKFDPAKHLRLDRALHRDRYGQSRWETFRDLALLERHRESNVIDLERIATGGVND